MNSDHPLEQHDLHRLEAAAKELDAHIKGRRRYRPSLARRIIGLCFSVPMFIVGSAILFWGITTNHFLGIHMLVGIGLFLGGGAWVYSDWIE